MNNNKEELDFLYDDDILSVFEKLGLKEDFLNGRLRCSACEDILTMDNFYSLYYEENKIKFGCNKKNCIDIIESKKS